RLKVFGRVGATVEPGDIRPILRRTTAASAVNLITRNALAPNAWRRGEEIVVESNSDHRHFLFGPYERLSQGWWKLTIDLSIEEAEDPRRGVVELEILHGQNRVLPPTLKLTPERCNKGPVSFRFHVPLDAVRPKDFEGAFEFR